jgi:hypothetical protein
VRLVVVKKDCEYVVRDYAIYKIGDCRQQTVKIESLRGNRRHLQQEIEQLGSFPKGRSLFPDRSHIRQQSPR